MGTNFKIGFNDLVDPCLLFLCSFKDLPSTPKSLKYAVLRLELLIEELKLLLYSYVRTSWHVGRGLG